MKQLASSNGSYSSFLANDKFPKSLLQWEFPTLFGLSLLLDLIKLTHIHDDHQLHSKAQISLC